MSFMMLLFNLLQAAALAAALPNIYNNPNLEYDSPFPATGEGATISGSPHPYPGSGHYDTIAGPVSTLASTVPGHTTSATTTSFTFRCDTSWCENSTSYCEYWAGSTSYDFSLGKPMPGEVRTSLGTCGSATLTSSASLITLTPIVTPA